jgi:hypothetical protein
VIGGTLDSGRLAALHRPTAEEASGPAFRELAAQGLLERDIAQHLKLDPSAVRRLLVTHSGGMMMKPDPRTSPAARANGDLNLNGDERAREQHARIARHSILKNRAPSEILTPDERAVLAIRKRDAR